jgi:hypothetical protein
LNFDKRDSFERQKAYAREIFCAFLTRFTGRMCKFKGDYPVSRTFTRHILPLTSRSSTEAFTRVLLLLRLIAR